MQLHTHTHKEKTTKMN